MKISKNIRLKITRNSCGTTISIMSVKADNIRARGKKNSLFTYLYRQKNQMKTWKGFGTINYENGSKYQGQTENSLYNGKGRLTHSNGDIYQGDWKDGFAHGKGCYAKVSEGVLYDGDYKEDF